jgi:hypothetical protein
MTAAEIAAEIAEINAALTAIRKGGQSYTMMSAAGAGTTRTVTSADYSALVRHRNELLAQLDEINGTRAVRVRAAW